MSKRQIASTLFLWLSGISVVVWIATHPSHETRFPEIGKLLAPDGRQDDRFGASVAVDGDLALVGTPLHDNMGSASGAAYLCRLRGGAWQVEKFPTVDAEDDVLFGASVAISGTTALVGAPGVGPDVSQPGAAYIFKIATEGIPWLVAKLIAADATPGDEFGHSVALSNRLVCVGAPQADGGAGAVYVYEKDAGHWREIAKLRPPDATCCSFGWSVALEGSTAIVSAPGNVKIPDSCGAAYVFERNASDEWKQVARLQPADASPSPWFGWSVALEGGSAVIGERSTGGPRPGAAHVFLHDGASQWRLLARLTCSEPGDRDSFAKSVAITGGKVIVGAPRHANRSGAAYVFGVDPNGRWGEIAKFTAATPHDDDWFGESIAACAGRVLIGSPQADDVAVNAGAVYAFETNDTWK